jgi:Ca-activated chloride channel family protein
MVWHISEAAMNITWANIEAGWIVVSIIIGACVVLVHRIVKVRSAVGLLGSLVTRKRLLVAFSMPKVILKGFLFLFGLCCIALTLMHPQWNIKQEAVAQHARDVIIALDISRSMLATDCVPNRLECAKKKIKDLVKQLSCERVGLMLFSGTAFMQCPLTSDHSSFFMFLDQVDVETIASGSTAFDQAILAALNTYKSVEGKKTKLLVMVTDGEDFSSNLSKIKQRVRDENMHVFTLGIGTSQGAPIPLFNEQGVQVGHMKDKKGAVVISRLNEGILSAVAHDSGGMYIRMTPHDQSDLNTLTAQIQQFEKEKIEDKLFSRMEEQYPYFLAVGFIALLIEWLL